MSEFLLLTEALEHGQYDVLHQLQDEVEFGIDGQLVVRFPLPRLHHISRLFTVEFDSRAPSRPPISQGSCLGGIPEVAAQQSAIILHSE
jgi:hypothetical protein